MIWCRTATGEDLCVAVMAGSLDEPAAPANASGTRVDRVCIVYRLSYNSCSTVIGNDLMRRPVA